MYKIEKGIPIPKLLNDRRRFLNRAEIIDTLKKMRRGNSVVVETRNRYISFQTAARRLGFIVTGQQTRNKKYRIWMVLK